MNINSKSILSLASILLLSMTASAHRGRRNSSSNSNSDSETVYLTQTVTETSEKTRNHDANSTTRTQARNLAIMQSSTTFVTGFDVRSNDAPSTMIKGSSICLIASLMIGGAVYAL